MGKKLILFIFLYLISIIYSTPTVSISLSLEDILTQKCYPDKSNQPQQNPVIYEISNNSTSNTVFIQFTGINNILITDSLQNGASSLYKSELNSGSYYLNLSPDKSKYYISVNKNSNNFKICFVSFPQMGNIFVQSLTNPNIKTSSFEILTNSNLAYFIDNRDLAQNKIFYTIRFDKKLLEQINLPKIQLGISFINSERQIEKIDIGDWYLQNNYYYAPFYVPKLNYTEKFNKVIICLNVELKQALTEGKMFKFDLELISSQEITCEYNINITPNTKDLITYPKVYYINLVKNIYQFDRDILLLKQDSDNKYIKPFIAPNLNISNQNIIFIEKNFVDINQNYLNPEGNDDKNKNNNKNLLVLIVDEFCDNIKENDIISLSINFYGGYHDLLHYKEGTTVAELFQGEKNKFLVKMDHCRPQVFINYFGKNNENNNDERILDVESSIGKMNLFYTNEISGKNIAEYYDNLKQNCVHKIENSILQGNFATFLLSCPDNNPVVSNIIAYKKNSKEDIITFINQKTLLYIEYNIEYSFQFNEQEKQNEFDFRIKIVRTNIEEDYKIDISYDNKNSNLDNKENFIQKYKHEKNNDSKLSIKIASNSEKESKNKGFVLEIFKSIDIPEDNIKYIKKEEKEEIIEKNSVIIFIYDKKEINSAYNQIQLYNTNDKDVKVNICIRSGKGYYPFVLKPECPDDNEVIVINSGESFNLSYNNPYLDDAFDEDEMFYISLSADNKIKYSYAYERTINLDENVYENLNHKGKKIYKILSNKGNKKSIYYQINLCENKNNKFYYSINDSDKILVKNDVYKECSLEELKSFLVEFDKEEISNAKFKYFYGPDKLLQTMDKFSKKIILSKTEDDKELILSVESPFVQQVDLVILFVLNTEEKYDNICSFEQFCKKETNNKNIFMIKKKVLVKNNKIEAVIDKKEIEELLDKDVDIYLIGKSLVNNLEIFYDIKSINLNWNKIVDEKEKEKEEDKNYLCINCGVDGDTEEQKEKNDEENDNDDNKDKKEKEKEKEEDEDDKKDKKEKEKEKDDNDEDKDNEQNNEKDEKNDDKDKDNDDKDDKDNDEEDKKNTRKNDDDNNDNNKNQQNDDNNFDQNNNIGSKDKTKNHEDDQDGDNVNDKDKDNDNDHDQDDPHEQDNNDNQQNQNNINENNPTNATSNNTNTINNEIINNQLNDSNINKNEVISNLRNKTISNVDILEGDKPKKRSRIVLYIILIIIIIIIIYCVINQCNNQDNVSYSKVSKYSYYDF